MRRRKRTNISQRLCTKRIPWTVERSEKPMLKEVIKKDLLVEKEGRKEYDRRTKERKETNWKEKSLHGNTPKSVADFVDIVSWQLLRTRYIKKNTEAIITASQDQALRTNCIKGNIDGNDQSPLCRVCQSVDGSSMYIASECEQLAKRR